MGGFIMIERDFLSWEWYQSPDVMRLFFHLQLKANYTDKKWQGHLIKKGQLITSTGHLSTELKLSNQKIRTALKKLKSSGNITCHTTNKFTLITIVNYGIRQSTFSPFNKPDNKQTTNEQQSNNNQITTTKERKKNNNINNETIETRIEKFKKEVFEHSKYSIKDLNNFFNYWSELDQKKSKMRKEKDAYFNVESRLAKWVSNEISKNSKIIPNDDDYRR